MIMLFVFFWIVHFEIYSCGYASYDWYAAVDYITDVYVIIKVMFWMLRQLYKEKMRSMKIHQIIKKFICQAENRY